ncbi:MAG: argininosuccinate synthase [Verrucomicrobia bacterium]|nr:argininosuccinate synthase [Verrucomicrobiota bacterium]MBV9674111.1 argininosuccinate synthase [Verrucomicrobiota bacterium]
MKIVVAYSGGLDTSVILSWIKDCYSAEVIAFCADIGQEEELDGLEEKALKTGASRCFVEDLREEFARDFIFPMFQASALYENQYLLGTSIARPLIAKKMVEIARTEKAHAIAHGATGKGNDQVRFELTAAALAPEIKVIAPWRLERFREQFPGRAEMILYAEKHGIPVAATAKKPYSMDRNLLHVSYESGILEDPWIDASGPELRDMYKLSVAPEDAPDQAEYLDFEFERGMCVALGHEKLQSILDYLGFEGDRAKTEEGRIRLSPYWVMKALNYFGGRNGIGRVDLVENRFVGMKSRGVYETPGGAILFFAHRQIESLTMDREVMHLRDGLGPKYAELVYNGFWFAPEREAIQALVTESQKSVTGLVRVKLYKGNIIAAGRKSTLSLYNPKIATMEADPTQAYNQSDATGFIALNALRLKVAAQAQGRWQANSEADGTGEAIQRRR